MKKTNPGLLEALLEEWLMVLAHLNSGQNYSANFELEPERSAVHFRHTTMPPVERIRFLQNMNRVLESYSAAAGLCLVSSKRLSKGEVGCEFIVKAARLSVWKPLQKERMEKFFRLEIFARRFIEEFIGVHLLLPEGKNRFCTEYVVEEKYSMVTVFITPVNGCVYPDPELHEQDINSEANRILEMPFAEGFAQVLRPRSKWRWLLRKGVEFRFKYTVEETTK